MNERVILLVDDEENIIRALTRVLRRDAYRILTANCGEEGLRVLEQNPGVGVILSDQRMPSMTGADFLSIVKARFPETVRIMLSGYTELTAVTDAINKGAIYKFLTKPWDDELLRANVSEAFARFEMRAENERLSRELARANRALAARVEDQSRVIDINQRVLEVSREVLEHLPVGVVGVGEDGVIAVANSSVHAMVGCEVGELVGRLSAEALPTAIAEPLRLCRGVGRMAITLGGMGYQMYVAPLGESSSGRGSMMVLVPGAGP